ncbi:MAG: SMC-Scp complex subunit ScpB [bacterium]|nr:SMC-Scp complex subunit ScpB [bacterium]
MSDSSQLASIVEALVLASPEPLPAKRISQLLESATPSKITEAVATLNNRYMETGSSFRIREIAGGYQFHILPDFIGYVEELFTRRRKMRLTRAALETVAIVAYKQPVTKTELEHIRGVASDGVLQNMMEKNMITIVGRASTVGKPLQYGTTDEFLKFFGLSGLDALPKMSEIEELLAAAQAQEQTELELTDETAAAIEAKLNVADGTYDPSQHADDRPVDAGLLTETVREVAGRRFAIGEDPQGESSFQSDLEEAVDQPVSAGDPEPSDRTE